MADIWVPAQLPVKMIMFLGAKSQIYVTYSKIKNHKPPTIASSRATGLLRDEPTKSNNGIIALTTWLYDDQPTKTANAEPDVVNHGKRDSYEPFWVH